MKSKLQSLILILVFAAVCSGRAQSTAFTYQGRLNVSGSPAAGNYDLRFSLFPTNSGGSPVANLITNAAVPVSNGLFTATLDFGNVFAGASYWLEIGVRTNGSLADFSTLTPRQNISATPSALYSTTAGNVTGVLAVTNLPSNVALLNSNANFTGLITAGSFAGNGAGLTNLSLAGANSASVTNQGALSTTGYATLNTLQGVQLTATPFKTPPMGWMSWNCCGTGGANQIYCYDMATNMLTNGMLALGYNLIQIDGGWQGYRDTNGFIHESAERFPDGMSNVVTKLHSMGFKVGIYTGINMTNSLSQLLADNEDAMFNTNFSNEQTLMNDAQTYVNWGIDYVKMEGGTNIIISEEQEQRWYQVFITAAQNAGKPLYIMGAVGNECSPWMYGVLNARRCGCFDIGSYDGTSYTFNVYLGNFWHAAAHPEYAGPGCFVSMDVIPASDPAGPTYMLMNAMMNAEIIWSWVGPNGSGLCDAAYLNNIIQIDQDPAALMARCLLTNSAVTVWKKPLGGAASPTFALAFFNTGQGSVPITTTMSFQSLGITSPQMLCLDLISNVTTIVSNSITVTVPQSTAYGFKLSPYTPAAVVTEGSSYTASINDRTILVSTSGKTITLPSAVGNSGLTYTVKLTVTGSCTVAASNSQKIDGASVYSLSAQYKYVTIQSDGAQWWVIASN